MDRLPGTPPAVDISLLSPPFSGPDSQIDIRAETF